MTTKRRIVGVVGLLMGLGAAPMAGWAAEHGGTTLGGGKEHGGQEHGGAAPVEGSHGMHEADEATLLHEAASALRKGQARPDLAEQLERMAMEHMQEE